jgi:cytochrome c oxidase subunit 4
MSSTKLPRVVLWTGAALLCLWGLSWGLSYVSLGRAGLMIALAIAAMKACLVVLFFMELLHESFSMKLAILAAGGLLFVLVGLVIADVSLREPPPLAPFGSAPGTPTAKLPSR